jgi:LacI family transcriptional regulator
MIRLVLLLDFTESYAHRVLAGIQDYVKEHDPWVVCRMPPSYKTKHGIEGVVDWAVKWHANAIIGQFSPDDDVTLFAQNGIVAIAQDYIQRFKTIPNITSNYRAAGEEVANYYLEKHFKNFAFFGYKDVVWSVERQEGFYKRIAEVGLSDCFYEYHNIEIENLWFYDYEPLAKWLESLPDKTGLMACDDNQAIKITEACRAIKRNIPEQVSVIGVDNDETLCNLSDPPLSSFNLNVRAGGYRTAELIATMVKERSFIGEDIFIEPLGITHRSSSNIFHTDDFYVTKAIKYINHNISSKLSVEDVLAQVPMSRRLFEIRFKQSTSMSIYQYIMHYRINLLANLLATSNETISELAYQVGFHELKNVSRQFKQIMGSTPTEYRNNKTKTR